jgi:hypothetical protein
VLQQELAKPPAQRNLPSSFDYLTGCSSPGLWLAGYSERGWGAHFGPTPGLVSLQTAISILGQPRGPGGCSWILPPPPRRPDGQRSPGILMHPTPSGARPGLAGTAMATRGPWAWGRG